MRVRLLFFAFLLSLTCLIGCGGEKAAESIYDDTEMAKYRSTPEQIEAGRRAAGVAQKPTSEEIKSMQDRGKAAAAAARPEN